MRCPRCIEGVTTNIEHQGVVVAVCNSCRGCWLEPGALRELLVQTYASAARHAASHAAAWTAGEERRGARAKHYSY